MCTEQHNRGRDLSVPLDIKFGIFAPWTFDDLRLQTQTRVNAGMGQAVNQLSLSWYHSCKHNMASGLAR
jgi:hypothetical protein